MFKRGDKLKYLGSGLSRVYIQGNIYTVKEVSSPLRFKVSLVGEGSDEWNFTAFGADMMKQYWQKVSGQKQKNLPEWW